MSGTNRKLINMMADDELARAQSEHGMYYSTLHEAYAVLREEIEEAGKEMAYIRTELAKVWKCAWEDDVIGADVHFATIRSTAIDAIEELTQVMAVCMKALRSAAYEWAEDNAKPEAKSEAEKKHECCCGSEDKDECGCGCDEDQAHKYEYPNVKSRSFSKPHDVNYEKPVLIQVDNAEEAGKVLDILMGKIKDSGTDSNKN